MDAKTLESLGGKVRKVTILYSRKVWAEGRGSVGTDLGIEVDVGSEADADALVNATYEYAREAVNRNMGEVMKKVVEVPAPHPATVVTPPVAPPPPVAQPVQQAPSMQQAELEPTDVAFDEIAEPAIGHVMTNNGAHACKVFGKGKSGANYEVWGVWAWDNMVDTAAEQGLANLAGWREWPLCKSSKQGFEKANRYQVPGAKAAIVQMKEKDGKPVADKAIGFK